MDLIDNIDDLKKNLKFFEEAKSVHPRDHANFVKRGTCFVAFDSPTGIAFAPSRFLGYRDNSFQAHEQNETKNGRDTNPVISGLLGSEPEISLSLNELYNAYCRSLGQEANSTGNFGAPRRFWDMRK